MPQTISTTLDTNSLPRWTRRHPAVIALCESNLAYRCDVFRADTRTYRAHLIAVAQRIERTA